MITQLLEALEESRRLGFLGPGPVNPHVDHAMAFSAVIDQPPARALDLGAGGGLPGLVLAAMVWPDTVWTFLDAQTRRTEFLGWAVERLDLVDRVTVVTGRAEEVGREAEHRAVHDLVVARSFGAPGVAAECAAPFLRPGGSFVVSEPPNDDAQVRWPAEGLAQLGFGPAAPRDVETAHGPVHLVTIPWNGPLDERFPRRVGIPAKRPLF